MLFKQKKSNYQIRKEAREKEENQEQETLQISEAIKKYRNPEEVKLLSSLKSTDKDLIQRVSNLESKLIDEQDTNIKRVSQLKSTKIKDKSATPGIDPITGLPIKQDSNFFDNISNILTGMLGGVAGLGLWKVISKLGKAPFELLGNIARLGITAISGLTGVIADITTGILRTVSKMIEPILNYMKTLMKLDLDKVGPKKPINDIKNAKSTSKMASSVEKILGKETLAVLKATVTKLPVVALLAGLGFGIQRAMDGDITGAGLEVISGVLASLPGVGTAASLVVDAGLIARDYAMDAEKTLNVSRFNDDTYENVKSTAGIDMSPIKGSYVSDLNRHVDSNLVDMVKKNEGFSPTYYPDAHGYSIGYGHFSKGEGSVPVSAILGYEPENGYITKEEAEILLSHDINKAQEGLFNRFPWVKDKPKVVQDNLIDMTYNMGLGGISKFKETLSLIKNDEYSKAAENLVKTKWYSQVGGRAKNIVSDFHQLGSGNSVTNQNNSVTNQNNSVTNQNNSVTNQNNQNNQNNSVTNQNNSVTNQNNQNNQNNSTINIDNGVINGGGTDKGTEDPYHMEIIKAPLQSSVTPFNNNETLAGALIPESNKDKKESQIANYINNITEKTKVTNITNIVQSRMPQNTQLASVGGMNNSGNQNININQKQQSGVITILDLFNA